MCGKNLCFMYTHSLTYEQIEINQFILFVPGTIAGCGGAFLPFSKGLDPIKNSMVPPVQTAFVGALCFHLYMNTSMSDGCIDAKKKAQVFMALYFIATALVNALGLAAKKTVVKAKKE